MHEEMQSLLNAYMDGELHGNRLQAMESHLASCATCWLELEQLRRVSDLLQTDTAPPFLPVDRFVSQLTMKLPRHPLRDLPAKSAFRAWWLVPAGLLGAWFFVQTVFTLTGVVTAANMTGLLGQVSTWLGSRQETIWFSAVAGLFGKQVVALPSLFLLNNVSVFGANLLSGFLWQASIGLLYWGWLFFWMLRRSPQTMNLENGS
jgi:anti-sigma factor RsiW